MLKDEGVPDLPTKLQLALREANENVDVQKASYEKAVQERVKLILKAERDHPRSQIAKALGITVGRVQQIVAKHGG
jgi:DNA-directed RNA polymerase specialized sigma24 family protein